MIAINYFAIVVAALAAMAVGWAWYSPLLFGKRRERMPVGETLLEFVTVLVTVYVIDLLVVVFGAHSARAALLLALVVWLGFYVTQQLSEVLWEQKPFKLFLIATGQRLLSLVLAALILGLWQ